MPGRRTRRARPRACVERGRRTVHRLRVPTAATAGRPRSAYPSRCEPASTTAADLAPAVLRRQASRRRSISRRSSAARRAIAPRLPRRTQRADRRSLPRPASRAPPPAARADRRWSRTTSATGTHRGEQRRARRADGRRCRRPRARSTASPGRACQTCSADAQLLAASRSDRRRRAVALAALRATSALDDRAAPPRAPIAARRSSTAERSRAIHARHRAPPRSGPQVALGPAQPRGLHRRERRRGRQSGSAGVRGAAGTAGAHRRAASLAGAAGPRARVSRAARARPCPAATRPASAAATAGSCAGSQLLVRATVAGGVASSAVAGRLGATSDACRRAPPQRQRSAGDARRTWSAGAPCSTEIRGAGRTPG